MTDFAPDRGTDRRPRAPSGRKAVRLPALLELFVSTGSMGTTFDIKRFAVHDGPGLRTTVFLKGCPLSCLGCHNPEGQGTGPELLFRPDRCTACGDCIPACPKDAIRWTPESPAEQDVQSRRPRPFQQSGQGSGPGRPLEGTSGKPGPITVDRDRCDLNGACVEACLPGALELVGKSRSVQEVLGLLEDDRVFFDESGGGVTFSGGEPFSQPDFLRELLEGCREREIPVVLDTCGHVAPETFRELAPMAAHLLFDLKLVDEERHEAFTGVHNRWILENLRWAAARKSRDSTQNANFSLTVRIPLIPGVNDDRENLSATADFLIGLERVPPVDLLPYHRLGVEKYHRTGRSYSLSDTAPPLGDSIRDSVRLLKGAGLDVTVRGERYGDD